MDKVLAREDGAEDISVGVRERVERANGTACRSHAPGREGVELAQGRRWVGNFGEDIEVAQQRPRKLEACLKGFSLEAALPYQ